MKTRNAFRILKRAGVAFVALLTLGALIWAIENYRGRVAWDRYQAEAAARGEQLDLKSFLPMQVPDAENFAATPLLAPLFDARWDSTTGKVIYVDTNRVQEVNALFGWDRWIPERGQGWRVGESVDLQAWQEALRKQTKHADVDLQALQAQPAVLAADDLLYLLGRQRDVLEELRAAARRPHASVPRRSYDDQLATYMPYIARMKNFSRVFQIKALAELAKGNAEAAAEDVKTILDLAGTLRREPLLISGLVRLAMVGQVYQPLWEGLGQRRWTDAQLAKFEVELSRLNLVEEMLFWLRSERAFSLSFFANGKNEKHVEGVDPSPSDVMGRMPAGWRYQNQVQIGRMFDDYVLPVLHPDVPMVDVPLAFELQEKADALKGTRNPYRLLAVMLIPAVQSASLKAAQGQADVHLARTACALERYFQAEGHYPERLEELIGRFLPAVLSDPVNGQPLQYRRDRGGRFLLYSWGTDMDDDEGRPVSPSRTSRGVAADGDWVWSN